jgi:hypothetical protein
VIISSKPCPQRNWKGGYFLLYNYALGIHCVTVFSYLSRPHPVSGEEGERREGEEGSSVAQSLYTCSTIITGQSLPCHATLTSHGAPFRADRFSSHVPPLGGVCRSDLATEITVCTQYSHVRGGGGWWVEGLGVGGFGVRSVIWPLTDQPIVRHTYAIRKLLLFPSGHTHTHTRSACVHQTSQASATSDNVR